MAYRTYAGNRRDRPGIVLLITLVILVILSAMAYTVSSRVAARRHRNSYLMDRAQAEYACSSAMKYAMVSLNDLDARLVSRPNEPDFSDVFAMSDSDYLAMLARFKQKSSGGSSGSSSKANVKESVAKVFDSNDPNNAARSLASAEAETVVPGPYGPRWPLVADPWQFDIASAEVTIEIEDENAKYPLGWGMIADEKLQAQANVGLGTFFEWMGYDAKEIGSVKEALTKVNAIRPFKMDLTPISAAISSPAGIRPNVPSTPTPSPTPTPSGPAKPAIAPARTPSSTPGAPPASGSTPATAAGTSGSIQRPPPRRVVPVAEQASQQGADLARLFLGGMLDTDLLSRPSVVSDSRQESAMKYLGLWGARQVNVNTAPHHVLEAALMFGSIADAPKMADAIIAQRKIKPFASVDELKSSLSRYGDSIDKCRDYITTASTVFTVRVTAVSGAAKVIAVAGVTKEGRQVKRMAIISD